VLLHTITKITICTALPCAYNRHPGDHLDSQTRTPGQYQTNNHASVINTIADTELYTLSE